MDSSEMTIKMTELAIMIKNVNKEEEVLLEVTEACLQEGADSSKMTGLILIQEEVKGKAESTENRKTLKYKDMIEEEGPLEAMHLLGMNSREEDNLEEIRGVVNLVEVVS